MVLSHFLGCQVEVGVVEKQRERRREWMEVVVRDSWSCAIGAEHPGRAGGLSPQPPRPGWRW